MADLYSAIAILKILPSSQTPTQTSLIHTQGQGIAMTSEPAPPVFWDRIGISLSGLCMVHCMVMPVVLAAVPLWSMADTLHDWLHPVLLILLVPISAIALGSTRGKPQAKSIRVLLGVGLFIIALASFLGHEAVNPFVETTFTLLGSSLLITGHRRNERICRRCVH